MKISNYRFKFSWINRFRNWDMCRYERRTLFALWPFLQFGQRLGRTEVLRQHPHHYWSEGEKAPYAICFAWLFWSIRLSFGRIPPP